MRELYHIDADIRAIIESGIDAETGELMADCAFKLDKLQLERDAKIEGVALMLKESTAYLNALKAEKSEIAKRQAQAEKTCESLKAYLLYATGGEKKKYPKATISFRSTKIVDVLDMEALKNAMPELVRYGKPEANKTEIKKLLESGVNIAGCELKPNTSVIVK